MNDHVVGRAPWRLGLGLPNAARGATADAIATAAAAAADQDWDDAWVSDHVVVDRSIADRYGHVYEALTTLAFVAGAHPSTRSASGCPPTSRPAPHTSSSARDWPTAGHSSRRSIA